MENFPKLISVDDHVIEHANVWQDRLPAKYRDVGPRVVQERGHMQFVGGVFSYEPADDGDLCDWWLYEDKKIPQTRLSAAAGFDRDEVKVVGITYEEMRKGCWDPVARLADMDLNYTEAQMCFPSFPRFCGQTFKEAQDMELADLCVKAYNDWMVEEWCGGSDGRLIPLIIVQLWDAELAAQEVYRNAERGVRATCFSE
ncbi:MAG TPA: amidohydrolase family protein, partial [Microthrixaceae bacterium]|nr:amidohydrolase family protein [Microthrixaceae bacterium]